MRTVRASDGRQLAYEIGGDLRGYPVIGLHGTPGCRFSRWPDDRVYEDAGVFYVTTDRAGYGQADRHPGRSVADEAADVLAVADALGLEQFGVVGGSGGGPHALACAALLSSRVERAASLSGLAPYENGGLSRSDWTAGMSDQAEQDVAWSEAGEEVLTVEYERQQHEMVQQLASDPSGTFADGLGEVDLEFLQRPEAAQAFARIVPEQAARGIGGWVDDSLAFVKPWGFDPRRITVPVLVAYGLLDESVPVPHGTWLSDNISTATTVIDREGGHLPREPVAEIHDNMAWLARGVVPPM